MCSVKLTVQLRVSGHHFEGTWGFQAAGGAYKTDIREVEGRKERFGDTLVGCLSGSVWFCMPSGYVDCLILSDIWFWFLSVCLLSDV